MCGINKAQKILELRTDTRTRYTAQRGKYYRVRYSVTTGRRETVDSEATRPSIWSIALFYGVQ